MVRSLALRTSKMSFRKSDFVMAIFMINVIKKSREIMTFVFGVRHKNG